jgi:hypothetical protein
MTLFRSLPDRKIGWMALIRVDGQPGTLFQLFYPTAGKLAIFRPTSYVKID